MTILQREEYTWLPIMERDGRLFDFEGGFWVQHLLSVYNYVQDLLHPRHSDLFTGILANFTSIVISKADKETKENGFYLQARSMEVLIPGRRLQRMSGFRLHYHRPSFSTCSAYSEEM